MWFIAEQQCSAAFLLDVRVWRFGHDFGSLVASRDRTNNDGVLRVTDYVLILDFVTIDWSEKCC